jgi:hypothetical protein
MILNSTPNDQAVLSNVGQVNSFTIKATAKSFNILASSLYANKIRAIVRELSCNAYDSHVAAGKQDVPFDVHLPNTLEPWFSIRDYGVGLNQTEVTTIFSTFFESTKTESNDFVGALGLGSKSPFSYTDNFTVTAIKNGVRGIYTAFINDQGVPSIALMGQENSSEPTGVEIRFGVEKREDFHKFTEEARHVYTYFKLRPVITGVGDFQFHDVAYEDRDIIPGVHCMSSCVYRQHGSVAVMGNIAYPIDVPSAQTVLGNLAPLLNCGLEINFAIGELDFQASREGLSYIPQTIDAIRDRLEKLNARLADRIAEQANAIPNLWQRAVFLVKKHRVTLWSAAVVKYIKDTGFKLIDVTRYGTLELKEFTLNTQDLESQYNIRIQSFSKSAHDRCCHTVSPSKKQAMGSNGQHVIQEYFDIVVSEQLYFVVNDTKVGARARARYHWTQGTVNDNGRNWVYVLEPVDKKQPMKLTEFFAAVENPPQEQRMLASQLLEKPSKIKGMARNVTILQLELRGSYVRRNYVSDMVWRDAGQLQDFHDSKTYYYLPISGFTAAEEVKYKKIKELHDDLLNSGIKELKNVRILGVRKSDLETVQSKPNWVNLEQYIKQVISTLDLASLEKTIINGTTLTGCLRYCSEVVSKIKNKNSLYVNFMNMIKSYSHNNFSIQSLEKLFNIYAPDINVDIKQLNKSFQDCMEQVDQKYPLLSMLSYHEIETNHVAVAEYINLIDSARKT